MVIYFGDDDMTRAAAYLSGILYHYDLPFHCIDNTQSSGDDFLESGDKKLGGYCPGQESLAAASSGSCDIRDQYGWNRSILCPYQYFKNHVKSIV